MQGSLLQSWSDQITLTVLSELILHELTGIKLVLLSQYLSGKHTAPSCFQKLNKEK